MRFGAASFGLLFTMSTVFPSLSRAADFQAQACMDVICREAPDIGTHVFYRPQGKDLKAATESLIKSELYADLQVWLKAMVQKRAQIQRLYNNANLSQQNYQASEEGKFIIGMINLLLKEDWYKKAMKFDFANVEINEEQLKIMDVTLSDEKINIVRDFYNIMLSGGMKFNSYDPIEGLAAILYPDLEFKDSQRLIAMQIDDLLKYQKSNWPIYQQINDTPLSLSKSLEGQSLTDPEQVEMALLLIGKIGFNKVRLSRLPQKFKSTEVQLQKIFQDSFAKYKKSQAAQAVKNPAMLKAELEIMTGACVSNLASKYADTPTETTLNQFGIIEESIRRASISILNRAGFQNVQSTFDKMEVNVPRKREYLINDWKKFIKEKTTQMQMQNQELAKISTIDQQSFEALTMDLLSEKEGNLFAEALTFCNHNRSKGIADNAVTAAGLINMSPRVLANPGLAYGVLAHEFGHLVHYRYYQHLGNIMACLTTKSKDARANGEDFADWFAGEVAKEIKSTENKSLPNLGCGMNFKFDNKWASDTLELPADDPGYHSSHFFRTIRLESQVKGLPNECRQYLHDKNRTDLDQECRL